MPERARGRRCIYSNECRFGQAKGYVSRASRKKLLRIQTQEVNMISVLSWFILSLLMIIYGIKLNWVKGFRNPIKILFFGIFFVFRICYDLFCVFISKTIQKEEIIFYSNTFFSLDKILMLAFIILFIYVYISETNSDSTLPN